MTEVYAASSELALASSMMRALEFSPWYSTNLGFRSHSCWPRWADISLSENGPSKKPLSTSSFDTSSMLLMSFSSTILVDPMIAFLLHSDDFNNSLGVRVAGTICLSKPLGDSSQPTKGTPSIKRFITPSRAGTAQDSCFAIFLWAWYPILFWLKHLRQPSPFEVVLYQW